MKVCIITSGSRLPVPSVRGGAVQTGIQQIVEENEKYNKMDLTVFSTYDQKAFKESLKYKNTKFYFIKYPQIRINMVKGINRLSKKLGIRKKFVANYIFIGKVYSHLRKNKYDFVIVKNNPRFCIKLSGVSKVVLQLHNDFLNDNTVNFTNIINSCDLYLTNSDYIKKRLLSIGSINPSDVYIHYNCSEIDKFSKSCTDEICISKTKQKLGIEPNEKVILFTGRPVKEKGIKELIIACKGITDIEYKLVIVGAKEFEMEKRNSYLDDLKIAAEAIKERVVFTGYVPYSDMPDIYAIADVVAIPSIWDEPAGRVVMEAQASKKPIIVSDSGGILEYTDEKASIVVKRGNEFINDLTREIIHSLENPVESRKRAEFGYEFVQKFKPKNYYFDLYNILKSNSL